MFVSKNSLVTLAISIFLSLLIFYIFKNQIIYPTIPPMVKNGVAHIFVDWSAILSSNLCKDRVDVYLVNPCDIFNRTHVYGSILLNIPFIKNFIKFYFLILPIIFNFLFIFILVSFFSFKKYSEYLSILPFIFSIPVLLAIERANIDILIFLFMVLIAYNKNIVFNYFSLILVTISKFYPVCFAVIFFFQKNFKKIILNTIFFILIVLLILFFELEEMKKLFTQGTQFSSSHHLSFSLNGFINHNNDLIIVFNNKNYNWVKYMYILFILGIPLVVTLFYSLKYIFQNSHIKSLFLENTYENRLYVLSSTVILACYFTFNNYMYREIFFLGLIPWILKIKNSENEKGFFTFYFYVFLSKFLFTTILIYLYRVHLTLFKPVATITKHCLDFYLISIVLSVFLSALYSLYKKLNSDQVPQKV